MILCTTAYCHSQKLFFFIPFERVLNILKGCIIIKMTNGNTKIRNLIINFLLIVSLLELLTLKNSFF